MKREIFRMAGLAVLVLAAGGFTAQRAVSATVEDMVFGKMPDVTVASSAITETVLNSVSTVSVIDRTMLDRYNFSTVSEALETVPGFMVWRTYLKGRVAVARGILEENYANKVLVMINNIPAWNAVTGEGDLDRVDIHDVERIEVLKGPASVLYGSNAYTGAVNIVLRKAADKQSQIGIIGGIGTGSENFSGNLGSYRAGGYYMGAEDKSDWFVSANSNQTVWPEYTFTDEAKVQVHTHESLGLNNFTARWQCQGHALFFNSTLENEGYLGLTARASTGLGFDHLAEAHLLNYSFNQDGDAFKLKYSLTYDWSQRNLARTADGNTRADVQGSRLVNLLDGHYMLGDAWDFELGVEDEFRYSTCYTNYKELENEVLSENNMRDRSLTEWSIFGQAGYQIAPWKILIGARSTHNQLFGNNLSSRGTVVYEINSTSSLKLIAGQSYRSPSLFELYFATVPVTVFGNPNLKPETSNSVELSYLTSVDNFFIQALGYYAVYDNNIFRGTGDFVYGGVLYPAAALYSNASRFSAKGAELEARYTLPSTQVFLSLDYVQGDQGDKVPTAIPGQDTYNFKYIPPYTISAGVSQDVGPCFVSGDINYYSDMNGPQKTITDNYWLDVTLGYKQAHLTHNLTFRNASGSAVSVPEYVRRNLNEVPLVRGMQVEYSLTAAF